MTVSMQLLALIMLAVAFTIILGVFSLIFKRMADKRRPADDEPETEEEPFFYKYEPTKRIRWSIQQDPETWDEDEPPDKEES